MRSAKTRTRSSPNLLLGMVAGLAVALLWREGSGRPSLPSVDAVVHAATGAASQRSVILHDQPAVPREALPATPTRVGSKQSDREKPPPPADPAAPTSHARLRVIVVDGDGQPVGGVQILRHAVFGASGERRSGELLAITGFDGMTDLVECQAHEHVAFEAKGHKLLHARIPAEGPQWQVTLPWSNRLEITLLGTDSPAGYHVEVALGAGFRERAFHQERYVTTPGRALEDTPAHWQDEREGSRWSLGFNAARRAVVDQLVEDGAIEVSLWRHGRLLETRALELVAHAEPTRIDFLPAPGAPAMLGSVVDANGKPVAGVRLRLSPFGGQRPYDDDEGFPIWAAEAQSGDDGRFVLARPDDPLERCVVTALGHGDRVLTIAELDQLAGRIVLEQARVVRLVAVDRDGEPMDGGWSSGIPHNYARPHVHLAHDVWRWPSPAGHPAVGALSPALPVFVFANLPAAVLRFRFTHLPPDDGFSHDTRIPDVRFVSTYRTEELQIGK